MTGPGPAWTRKAEPCAAVEAQFAWFSQACGIETRMRVEDEDGQMRPVCREHFDALQQAVTR